jgi:hypothetical protein
MFATIFVHVPLLLLPVVDLPAPTRDCQIEILSPLALEERTLAQFDDAVNQYVMLHRRLERALPPEQMFDDAEDMFAAVEALRSAIVEARPNVREGDIFTPGISELIRTRLEDTIKDHHYTVAKILAAINEERLPGMPDPELNHPFPWGLGSAMWPSLLAVLPSLPPELEYRFADRKLVLIDMHADMVVDILDNALPKR